MGIKLNSSYKGEMWLPNHNRVKYSMLLETRQQNLNAILVLFNAHLTRATCKFILLLHQVREQIVRLVLLIFYHLQLRVYVDAG